jgi:GTP-binding protein EngB required for normal cell division
MTMYQCELCGRTYDEPWCTQDQRELTRVVETPASSSGTPASPPADAGGVPPPRDEVVAAIDRNAADLATPIVAPEPPRPRPRPADPAPQQQPEIAGLAEFRSLLDRGFRSVVVCGLPRTGKSQIVNAFTKANTIFRGRAQFEMQRATLRTEHALGATVEREVWYQVADDRHVFLDPSGEFFRALSLEERQRLRLGDITDDYFDFVRDAVRKLAGIVLVVDLFGGGDQLDRSGWRAQENDFTFVLPALRWLRFEKEARPPGIGVSVNIAARVQKLPKLDVPVLVLFSKADRLDTLTNQVPLDFARRNLPVLHGALLTHAKRFRFDFCHTMVRTGDGDRAVDRPCGVLLSMEWLLNDRFRWLPRLSTTSLGGGKR